MDVERRAKELIDVARARHGATAADAERVKAKLRARVAAEPLLIEPLAAAPPSAGWLRKLLAVFAAGGGAGFAAGFWVAQTLGSAALPASLAPVPGENGAAQQNALDGAERSPTPNPLPQPSHAPREAAAPPAPNPLPEAPAVANAAPRAEPSLQTPPPAARSAPAEKLDRSERKLSSLEAELEGLRRAQELLHKGDAAWALARLDELDRSGASSVLMEERRATRAMAECMLGKSESCARTKPGLGREDKADPRQTEPAGSRHQSEEDGNIRKGN